MKEILLLFFSLATLIVGCVILPTHPEPMVSTIQTYPYGVPAERYYWDPPFYPGYPWVYWYKLPRYPNFIFFYGKRDHKHYKHHRHEWRGRGPTRYYPK
ncbi:MAG: hypothetical protein ACD_14C00048G0001 [uncultured bacterium]|nr:MAG: hypothetical protein ACD_14C00048G0001 [uncultured bacterium]